MKIADAFPSNWLQMADVEGGDLTVTIEQVSTAKMRDGKTKPVLYFRGQPKGLILNKTNARIIEQDLRYGDDMDQWVGKRITLYGDPNISFGDEQVGGIRVRKGAAVAPKRNPTPPQRHVPKPQTTEEELDDEVPFN